ncbi:MAG: ubiquinone-binding protein, partial [Candidatus Regiella insecticola]|nr:ubiquinone-binding protein [Candidatus Regiella insecticola]
INNKSINMELVDGPFRKLLGDWQFTPLNDNTCKVELYLDFEFTNKLVEIMFGNLFKALAENMVQAFSQRAET